MLRAIAVLAVIFGIGGAIITGSLSGGVFSAIIGLALSILVYAFYSDRPRK